jgi:hypothetical protein
MIWLSLDNLMMVEFYIHVIMICFLKMLVIGPLVNKFLYIILTCFVTLLCLNHGWIACFDQMGSKTF